MGRVETITDKFNLLVIYEDIEAPVITGSIQIIDNIDLYSQLELHGQEYIYISFHRPNDTENSRFKRSFRIYKAGERKPSKSQGQEYVLYFCSEEWVFSNQQTISRAFTGRTINNYVYAICSSDLKINRSKLDLLNNFDISLGIQDIVVPRMHPLEAIQFLSQYAFDDTESTFLFFENRTGFNFISLATLFNREPLVTLNYSNAKLTEGEQTAAFKNANQISNFKFNKSFDIMKTTQNLTYSGRLYTLDLLRQKYEKYDYTAGKMDKSNFLDGGNLPINNAPNRNEKPLLTQYDSSVNFFITNKDLTNTARALSKAFRSNNTNVERTLLQRQSQLNMLKNVSIEAIVPGNAMFSVGFIINFDLPAFARNGSSERVLDPYHSGKYLITNVKHVITPSGGHQTILGLSKNSLASSLDFVTGTRTEYKKVRGL